MLNRTSAFLLVFFMLLGVAFLGYWYKTYKEVPKNELAVLGNPGHKVGAFSFINQNGNTITEKDVAGKIKVVEYFFTTCQSICPKMNDNMAKVYQNFQTRNDVVILSHTVDPETDTVAQLKRYADKFNANPDKWMFLTGSKQDLYTHALYDYLVSAVEDTTAKKILPDFIHSERFVLVDKDNRIRGKFYDGTSNEDVKQLIEDIRALVKEN